ncbi:MAG TPA: hypothetical protein VHA52_10415 [Candidatus Babeliaceae bacterium]|nr:hypothetical protein [Candidatus Babeliaceae bacterium]
MVNPITESPTQSRSAPHVISLFIKPYLANAHSFNDAFLKNRLTPQISQGIFAVYGGFFTYSNYLGQILFPRKHIEDTITFIVTPTITPIITQGNTVHHFVIDQGSPVNWYQFSKAKNSTGKTVWKVSKQDIPKNRTVPIYSIVLLEDPKLIHIPEQEVQASTTGNLILPDIYLEPIVSNDIAVRFLKISNYFAPLRKLYRYGNKRYAFALESS